MEQSGSAAYFLLAGYVGMALSYALSLNVFLVYSVQMQSMLSNSIISVERLEQYMHIRSEAPETIDENQPPPNWPSVGRVEISNLKVLFISLLCHKPYAKTLYCIMKSFNYAGQIPAKCPFSSAWN